MLWGLLGNASLLSKRDRRKNGRSSFLLLDVVSGCVAILGGHHLAPMKDVNLRAKARLKTEEQEDRENPPP